MNAAAPYPPAGMAFDRARPHHAWTRSPDPAYPMLASILDFLAGGLLQFGWGEMLLYLLVATQLTIFAVTLSLDRKSVVWARVCQYVSISVVAVTLKKKKNNKTITQHYKTA